jgi:hypothetical protein
VCTSTGPRPLRLDAERAPVYRERAFAVPDGLEPALAVSLGVASRFGPPYHAALRAIEAWQRQAASPHEKLVIVP